MNTNYSSLEMRVRKLESMLSKFNKKVKNESVKQLPNGMLANRVSDILAGVTNTSTVRPNNAIMKLDRMGILDSATNKWYPTADDVAEAIEDCWDDQIGAVGAGSAQFFIGEFGGAIRCSLTIHPISGGDSRARNITLKFIWPEDNM